MSAFAFVPRKVVNKGKTPTQNTSSASAVPPASSTNNHSDASHSVPLAPVVETVKEDPPRLGRRKAGKNDVSDEDLAVLVELALSDYALWADPDLRRAKDGDEGGYLPLGQLLASSQLLQHLDVTLSQSTFARAIRTHCTDTLELRMLVTAPSSAPWHTSRASTKAEAGGFEVRRKGGHSVLSAAEPFTKAFWDVRTLYVENVPIAYRSVAGIARFVRELVPTLSSPSSSLTSEWLVQHIHLPPHHLDKPGSAPKCKGFAFVTLRNEDTVKLLIDAWPWESRWNRDTMESLPEDALLVVKEARKTGLRALSKLRWNSLKEEYIEYKASLLREIDTGTQSPPTQTFMNESVEPPAPDMDEISNKDTTRTTQQVENEDHKLYVDSPYPPGCLVFVKHVHAQTNKTTLRTLFSAILGENAPTNAIDYVDYTKGMDNCHLRLATPGIAQMIVAHFVTHTHTQKNALDTTGTIIDNEHGPAITVELVEGTRESLYWERVPEKVRRQAVLRTLGSDVNMPDNGGSFEAQQQGEGGGRRKRRRR